MSSNGRAQTKPARVLLGWMEPQAAVQALAGYRESESESPEHHDRAARARRAAAARRPAFGVRDVVSEPPDRLREHEAKLAANPVFAPMFAAGTEIALVDLRRVVAFQSGVTIEPVPELDPDDLESLASFTIRPPAQPKLDVQYDAANKAWVILAPDPNLRIVDEVQTDLGVGAIGLGFELREFGSSVRAVRHRDRWILVDGYHRATALLARGIHVVPGLVGEVPTPKLLNGAAGIRPEDFLGARPPLIPDFWDDEVSAEVNLPATTRVLYIEALDLLAFE
jgi:hypothetical protein